MRYDARERAVFEVARRAADGRHDVVASALGAVEQHDGAAFDGRYFVCGDHLGRGNWLARKASWHSARKRSCSAVLLPL